MVILSCIYQGEIVPQDRVVLRANRIGTFNDKMQLLCETHLDTVRQVMERLKPEVAIIDSIQNHVFGGGWLCPRQCFPGKRVYQCADADR